MTNEQLKSRFPRASESFLKANLPVRNTGKVAVVESSSSHAPLAKEKVQRPAGQRVLVRTSSFCKRLADEDGLCEKYHIDLLRYASIISGDSPDKCKIETCQFKVKKGEQEKIVIEVWEI